jgi:excisionase family DNA binding protein
MQTEQPVTKPDRQRHLLRGPRKGEKKPPLKPRPPNPNRLTLTKRETADELGVSVRTVDELIKDGKLAACQIRSPRTLRILRTDLLAFLEGVKLN